MDMNETEIPDDQRESTSGRPSSAPPPVPGPIEIEAIRQESEDGEQKMVAPSIPEPPPPQEGLAAEPGSPAQPSTEPSEVEAPEFMAEVSSQVGPPETVSTESATGPTEAPPGCSEAEEPAAPPAEPLEQAEESDVAALADALSGKLHEALGDLARTVDQRMDGLENAVAALGKQVSHIPPQVTTLWTKVDGMGTAFTESRFKRLLLGVIRIYDLLDSALNRETLQNDSPGVQELRRDYEVLRTQLLQLLALNGLSEVPTDGTFDPEVHQPMRHVPCDDPDLDDHIRTVFRKGFRTEQAVLRPADVELWRYERPKESPPPDEPQDTGTEEPATVEESPREPPEVVAETEVGPSEGNQQQPSENNGQ